MQKIFKVPYRFKTLFLCIAIYGFQVQNYSGFAQLSDNQYKIRTIVIDAGHGGKDSGAIGKHSKEKDIALAISLIVGKYINEKTPEINVLYTRTTDVFVPLHERAKIANDNNADLFISIHVNSNPKSSPSGTSSHVLGLHRMNENFEVAKRENSVILLEEDYKTRYEDFDPNSPESYIMFSLMQDVYFDQSIYFGQMVQDQFRDRARRKDRGVKQQGLLVLAQTSMPGILIETGFISNPTEEKYLMSNQGQDYLASAIFRAFRDYKHYIEGNTSAEQIATVSPKIEETKPTNNSEEIQNSENESIDTVINTEPTNSTSSNKKENNTNDVVYKVQILNSKNPIKLNDNLFVDFNDVQELLIDGKYKYVVGAKNNYTEAVEYSKWVKSRHPGAFVVAISNGKIIPLSQVSDKTQKN